MVTYTIAAFNVQDQTKSRSLHNTMSSTASGFSYRSEDVMVLVVRSFLNVPFRHKDGTQQGLRDIGRVELHGKYSSMTQVC
jgi:hypothetical protein